MGAWNREKFATQQAILAARVAEADRKRAAEHERQIQKAIQRYKEFNRKHKARVLDDQRIELLNRREQEAARREREAQAARERQEADRRAGINPQARVFADFMARGRRR